MIKKRSCMKDEIAHTVGAALRTVLLHSNVSVEMIQRSVSLGAIRPGALVETLDLVVPTTRSFLDSIPWQRNKGVVLAVGAVEGGVAWTGTTHATLRGAEGVGMLPRKSRTQRPRRGCRCAGSGRGRAIKVVVDW